MANGNFYDFVKRQFIATPSEDSLDPIPVWTTPIQIGANPATPGNSNVNNEGVVLPMQINSNGTTDVLQLNCTFNANAGICRGIHSAITYAGTALASTTVNAYALRGFVNVTGTLATGNMGYAVGVQGRCELTGTMTDGVIAGVLAQISASAGTFTGGTICGLWVDCQLTATPSGSTFNMVKISNSPAAVAPNSFISLEGGATNALSFNDTIGNTKYVRDSTVNAATGSIKVSVNGNTRYLLYTAT